MSRLAPLFAAALLLLAPGCGSTPSPGVDRAEVSRVVSQVMSPQVRIGVREKLQALEELETFLMATERRSEQVARALTQLADLYLTVELSTYERAVSRYNREPSGTPPTLNHDRSIRIYEKVLADYPKRPRNHTVRYQLARAYDDLGHFESEVAMLEGLLRRHPTSEYALEATYRLGELAFDDGRLQHAVKYYDRVLKKSPEGELADYAAYKRTWSLYLMPDPDRAARAAVAFIDSRRVRRGGRLMLSSDAMPEPDWERVREILTLLARVLHEQGGARALARYLPEHRDYLHQVYRKLGEVSVQMGNPAGAIATYEAFLSRFPNDSQAPSVLGQVVDIHTDQGDVDSAVAVRARLVDEYGPKSDWWSHQSAAVRRTVGPAIEKTVHQLARHYHSVAQESGAKADYDRAVHWYNRYLREYPNVAAAPGTVFLIGEALFEAGDYSGAAFAYRRSAYDYPRHKKSGEAAYAQVYALERYLSEAKPGSATYRERLAALSDAFKSLVSAYPREPRLPQAYERITGLLFEQGDHNTLYEVADHVIRYGPRLRDLHARAWRTFGEAAFETGRYDTAEEALGKALTILQGDANASPETISELKKLLAVNAISRAEEEGGGADALLKAVALVDPDDPLAEPARFDVAMALFRDDRLEEALQSFGDYGVAYPDSHRIGQVAQTVLAVGERALELGDTELARRAWARYREWFGGVDSARDLVVVGLEARAYLEEGDLAAADEAFAGLLSRYSDGMAPEELVDRLAGVRF
ncbi:MAG: tetratricopeptide repeat protein, partial [Leptospirillia bacterium]